MRECAYCTFSHSAVIVMGSIDGFQGTYFSYQVPLNTIVVRILRENMDSQVPVNILTISELKPVASARNKSEFSSSAPLTHFITDLINVLTLITRKVHHTLSSPSITMTSRLIITFQQF